MESGKTWSDRNFHKSIQAEDLHNTSVVLYKTSEMILNDNNMDCDVNLNSKYLQIFTCKRTIKRIITEKKFDHYHLEDFLCDGLLPFKFLPEIGSIPKTYKNALEEAALNNYRISKKSMNSAYNQVSESEKIVWKVVCELLNGEAVGGGKVARCLKNLIIGLFSSFVIPNINNPEYPWVADQLWLVIHEVNGTTYIRKIVLEVDGEYHARSKQSIRDIRKNNELEKLGYEIYRVSGAWARIDPYRVICEFLVASKICPQALETLPASGILTINMYSCCKCEKPLGRYSFDGICLSEDLMPMHKLCEYS